MLVEEWLTSFALAPRSKGHVRSIMHILFNWAMKWEYIDIDRMNPISLVRVEGSSKYEAAENTFCEGVSVASGPSSRTDPNYVHCRSVSWSEGERACGFAVLFPSPYGTGRPRRTYRLAQLSALLLHALAFLASGPKGSAGASPPLRHSHHDEHLHAGGA